MTRITSDTVRSEGPDPDGRRVRLGLSPPAVTVPVSAATAEAATAAAAAAGRGAVGAAVRVSESFQVSSSPSADS